MSSIVEKSLTQLLTGSRIVFLGLFIRSGVLFLCEILLARILGPTDYGHITFSLSLINLCSIISGIGLNTASRRYIPILIEHPEKGSLNRFVRFSGLTTLVVSLAVVTLVYAAVLIFSSNLPVTQFQLILILSLAIPFWSLQKLYLGMAAGLKHTRLKVLIEDLFVPFGFLTVILFAYFLSFDISMIVIGYVVIFGVSAILVGIGVYKHQKIVATRERKTNLDKIELFKFSWPLVFTEVLGKATGMVEFLIIGLIATSTELGLYRPASDLAITMSIILMGFSFLYLPMISEYFAKSQFKSWRRFNARVARLSMFLSFPIFSVLFYFPTEVLVLIYGHEYSVANNALRILAITYFFHTAVGFSGLNLVAAGHTRVQLVVMVSSVSALIISAFLLVPKLGILGAAYATLIGIFLSNSFNIFASVYYMRLHPFDMRYLRAISVLLGASYLLNSIVGLMAISDAYRIFVFVAMLLVFILLIFITNIIFDNKDRESILAMIYFQSKKQG